MRLGRGTAEVAAVKLSSSRPGPLPRCSVECMPLEHWREALARHREPFRNAKVLLTNYHEDACL